MATPGIKLKSSDSCTKQPPFTNTASISFTTASNLMAGLVVFKLKSLTSSVTWGRFVNLFLGEPVKLSLTAEEVATFYAKMLDHEYTTKPVFQENFFTDWREVQTPRT